MRSECFAGVSGAGSAFSHYWNAYRVSPAAQASIRSVRPRSHTTESSRSATPSPMSGATRRQASEAHGSPPTTSPADYLRAAISPSAEGCPPDAREHHQARACAGGNGYFRAVQLHMPIHLIFRTHRSTCGDSSPKASLNRPTWRSMETRHQWRSSGCGRVRWQALTHSTHGGR